MYSVSHVQTLSTYIFILFFKYTHTDNKNSNTHMHTVTHVCVDIYIMCVVISGKWDRRKGF